MTKLLPLIALVACLTSCPETKVPRHFGLKPATLKAAEWEGDWSSPDASDDPIHLAIDHTDQGALISTEPAKDGKKGSSFKIYVWHQSAAKDSHLYFFSLFEKPGEETGSIGLLTKPEANVFYLWNPNHEAIAEAIKSGRLKGKLEKNKNDTLSTLAADPANYTALGSPEFWDWTRPSASVRNVGAKH